MKFLIFKGHPENQLKNIKGPVEKENFAYQGVN